jgi:hypothetical protein
MDLIAKKLIRILMDLKTFTVVVRILVDLIDVVCYQNPYSKELNKIHMDLIAKKNLSESL